MTSHTAKIAVSVPAKTLRSVETARRRLGRTRSSVVVEALDSWLAAQAEGSADRAYLEAYTRQPEPAENEVAAAIVSTWAPWEDASNVPPARARPGTAPKVAARFRRRTS